jgi:type II secretory pathway component PulK
MVPNSPSYALGGRRLAAIAALGVVLVLTAVAIAVFSRSAGSHRATENGHAVALARTLAEAGLNDAVARLANSPNPLSRHALPPRANPGSSRYTGGVVAWWGTLHSRSRSWTIDARSTVREADGSRVHASSWAQVRIRHLRGRGYQVDVVRGPAQR